MRFLFAMVLVLNFCAADNMIFAPSSAQDSAQVFVLKDETNATLTLKSNQTLVVNHNTNALLYILEITPNGGVKKIELPIKFRGKKSDEVLTGVESLNQSAPIKAETKPTATKTKQDSKKSTNLAPKDSPKNSQDLPSNFKNRMWDKNKIIYEQEVETILVK